VVGKAAQEQLAATDLHKVKLADTAWKSAVTRYLASENQRGSGYQRLRGQSTTDKQRDDWAGTFRKDAGMDDLVLFLLATLGIERTTVGDPHNADKMIDAVHGDSKAPKPKTERVEGGPWAKAKARIAACLAEGGAAMLSLRHKGKGQAGTHIVAVQTVEADGLVLDDPYGRIRADYSADRAGDAYAFPGKTRRNSGLKNEQGGLDDWKNSGSLETNERRGEYSPVSDATIGSAWNYVLLFRDGYAARAK
jgi:hypothetical protein